MRNICTIFLFLFLLNQAFSQNEIRCSHGANVSANDVAKTYELEKKRNSLGATIPNLRTQNNQVYTIPIVFHIVYNKNSQYISYAQVLSQLKVLNADYRRLNSDTGLAPSVFRSLGADAGIEFCLAKQDPNGLPTTGVTYTSSSTSSFSYDTEDIKFTNTGGKDAWDTDKYLNVWVCNLQGGILGYYPYPMSIGTTTDGVVINYKAFGTLGSLSPYFNLGRTATHEIGHWLGLYHPWGTPDGDACSTDFVDDTPPQASSTPSNTTNCPAFPYIDVQCNNGPDGRVFSSFMDYTKDACMNLFTKGQVQRMRETLLVKRASILNSDGCKSPFKFDVGITQIFLDTTSSCIIANSAPTVQIVNMGSDTVKSYTIELKVNGISSFFTWTGVLPPGKDTSWTFQNIFFDDENFLFEANIQLISPSSDQNNGNNYLSKSFRCNTPLSIYPNPVINLLKFKGNTPTVISATLYDLAGKEMLKVEYPHEIDVSNLQAGFYLGVFETSQNTIRQQFIVVH